MSIVRAFFGMLRGFLYTFFWLTMDYLQLLPGFERPVRALKELYWIRTWLSCCGCLTLGGLVGTLLLVLVAAWALALSL
ncbi:MAG: hypothetical protein AB1566_15155 [Chloroflexota bacterium]